MPRRPRTDENANVPPRMAGALGARRALGHLTDSGTKKSISSMQMATTKERKFAREIKNLSHQTRGDALTLPTVYHDSVLESGAFRALVREFETL